MSTHACLPLSREVSMRDGGKCIARFPTVRSMPRQAVFWGLLNGNALSFKALMLIFIAGISKRFMHS